jgi:hypothetical protein
MAKSKRQQKEASQIKNGQLKVGQWVLVTWYDAASATNTAWMDEEDAAAISPLKVKTAGRIVKINKHSIALVMNYIKKNREACHVFSVPMAWITGVKVID